MNKFFTNLFIFASVAGPSIVTTMAGNDAGGVVTYSLSGANFGYGLMIILPFLTLIYGLTQEIAGRLAIVTGRGLADLIRERYGVRIAIGIFILVLFSNVSNLVVDAAALKVAFELFGLHGLWIPIAFLITIVMLFLIVTKFNYQMTQRIFLVGATLYIAYIISAFRTNPDWLDALRSLFIPTKEFWNPETILTGIAFIGTTVTPWGQFFIQSYMKDKKLGTDRIGFAKIEAYLGAILSNIVTFFIIVATKSALFDHGIKLVNGEHAALAIKPFAGELASFLYAFGLFNAAIIGLIIISLSTSYVFTEMFGFEGTLDAGYKKGKNFYTLFLVQICIACTFVLFPFISAYKIAIVIQAVNTLLLPVIFIFLIRISTDKGLMRTHVVGPVRVALLVVSAILIVCASAFSIIYNFIG
ncbi:MAG: divalent metal cation transporter [Candidatus Roizmanbacteria bacterium]